MNDSDENKAAFAAELLKNPNDPFKAALAVFPNDTGYCLRVARDWPHDELVKTVQKKLLDGSEPGAFLPTKDQLSAAIWSRMNPPENGYVPVEDFVKLAKLYADVRGFIMKPEAPLNLNINQNNKVMVVRDLGTNEDWEAKAERQQRNLVNVSTSRH